MENSAILCETQHAGPCPWLVRGGLHDTFPSDLGAFSIRFGQLALTLQLHSGVVLLELAFLFSTVLLCLEMRIAMLGMQL